MTTMTRPPTPTEVLTPPTPREDAASDLPAASLHITPSVTSLLRDPERLAAVRRTGLLDSAPEEAFDRITRLATRLLGVPVSLITIVDDERQFFKSLAGVPDALPTVRSTPVSDSFCQHVVDNDAALVVDNARIHPLVRDSPAIDGLGVEAYLGVPFHDEDGHPIGALCAIESAPRAWTDEEVEVLADLADTLRSEMALRAVARELLADGLADARAHEQRERVSQERFLRLTNNSTAMFMVGTVDPDLQFQFLSDAAEELTGHPARSFMDDPDLPRRLMHADDREAFERYFWNPDGTFAYRSRHADGDHRWLSIQLDWLHPEGGGAPEFLAIVRDVDAERRAELSRERAIAHERELVARLSRVEEMKDTFLTAVSHELRTPLTSILGFTQLLLTAGDRMDEQERLRYLERLRANADQLKGLLTDLLDVRTLSTTGSGRRTVQIDELVRQLVETVDTPDRRVTARTEQAEARVERAQMARAFAKVLHNALQHTPPDHPIEVEVTRDADEVIITVADRGPGIPDSLKIQAFAPLTHGPQAGDAPSPGLGLGLTLARQLVELQDGRVWIEDRPDGGALVRIALPAFPERSVS